MASRPQAPSCALAFSLAGVFALAEGCSAAQPCPDGAASGRVVPPLPASAVVSSPAAPTADDAAAFVKKLDTDLRELWTRAARAQWVAQTFINEDSKALAAAAEEASMAYLAKAIPEASRLAAVPNLPPDVARQLQLVRLASSLPAPSDPSKVARLAKLSVDMQAHYGAAKVCKPKAVAPKPAKYAKPAKGAAKPAAEPEVEQVCLSIGEVSKIVAESRKPADLLEAWRGWHDTARPLRADFEEFVRLANEGAREIGFADVGALWRSGYDMTPDELEADVERMWQDVKPLYDRLHCYVRGRLQKKYGADVVPSGKPIPAHLLGNLWAQEWVKLYDVLAPYPGEGGLDVSKSIAAKRWTSKEMVRAGESFFTSLGFQPLPESFWSRSLFDKPKDRDVVCHASAWDLDLQKGGDLRIKMCIEPTEEDLVTIHHELGHVFYYQAYTKLPVLFQAGANDGFHEGIGDAIALAMTPAYYQRLGLLGAPKSTEKADLNFLLKAALERVAFLPFGMLIDKWRWDVFSGKTPPAKYNEAWWELRRTYQGVAPAVARTEADFDAGAKYHVPANVPYVRYFLARLYQFQFHEALCKAAGHTGPLHTCSIFASDAAGRRLRDMLALGASKPWPEAMQAIAGSKKGDAKPMLEYFAPLSKWLDEQNKGQACGW